MKSYILYLFSLSILIVSCQQWNLFSNEMSQEDESALAEMLYAIEMTDAYNDTLGMYSQDMLPFTQEDWDYCEDQYHYYDSLFNHFNDMYSHENNGDDHEHDNQGQMHERMHKENSQRIFHSMNDHEQMDAIRMTHTQFH